MMAIKIMFVLWLGYKMYYLNTSTKVLYLVFTKKYARIRFIYYVLIDILSSALDGAV